MKIDMDLFFTQIIKRHYQNCVNCRPSNIQILVFLILTLALGTTHAASLGGVLSVAPANVNLTTEGTADWTHWTNPVIYVNRKANVAAQIGNYTVNGADPSTLRGASTRAAYSWSDGTPVASASQQLGTRLFALGGQYQVSVPASTTARTLRVYVGLRNARGLFTASLSDNSAPVYSTVINQPSGLGSHMVTLNYQAASAGQSLTFRFTLDTLYSGGSELILEAATLTGGDGGGGGGGLPLPFSDNFNDGNAQGWTVFDEAGAASNWTVSNGQYQQVNQIRQAQASFEESYHLGSFSYLVAGMGLTDYQATMDATPRGLFGDDIGVMFRYQNPDNYYRLSFDSRYGYTRLEKRVNGQFSALATNYLGYRFDQLVSVSIQVVGSNILVYLDNDLLFGVQDTSLSQGSVALYSSADSRFDNVQIQNNSTAPRVVLSRPIARTVSTTNSISASALAINHQAGRVDFVLDGTTTISDSSAPYSATFNNVVQGEHTVTARLFNSGGSLVASDVNTVIGSGGINYLTVGDSITNGTMDNFGSDNASSDGRIFGFQGYQAALNDSLTQASNRPHVVVNEGIGGDTSALTANQRISSILARNPGANRMLIFLGTNDAGSSLPIASGLGCSGSSCNGTFKGNMQNIINAASSSGKSAFVALAPPSFGSSATSTPFSNPLNTMRNNTIQEYNQVVSNELTNRSLGPNLFQCFLGAANRFSLFADNYHPNGLGYSVISQLWNNILTGVSQSTDPCTTLPRFTLENLSRSTVSPFLKQNLIEVGDQYYVNASFTVSSIPSGLALENGVWVMNSNTTADRNNTNTSNYLSFSTDRNATVYIGYDNRATQLPAWLNNNYTSTGTQLGVSQAGTQFNLYRRNVAAGTITLGGNLAAPAAGAQANYVVIVVPQ